MIEFPMKDGSERGVETSACQKPAERLGQLTRVPLKQLHMLYGSESAWKTNSRKGLVI